MEKITLPKYKFMQMKRELKILRNVSLYKRLLEFERNIIQDKKYTRKDLGF